MDSPEQTIKRDKIKIKINLLFIFDFIFIIVICFSIFIFSKNQEFNFSNPIASDIWSHLGSFVGGLLGTIISYIGIRLLVGTLSAQRQANLETIKNNNENRKVYLLQLFDNNFNTLLKLYEETINSYTYKETVNVDNKDKEIEYLGRAALHKIAEKLRTEYSISSEKKYINKVKAATITIDNNFYIPNRDIASVHFRTLYQIFQLIRESEIEENKKVLYAKIMRGQMTEDELFFLRYNCLSPYGIKMRININKYNLLKHLQVLNLIEFSLWRTKLNRESMNSIDTQFTDLKKKIKDKLLSSNKCEEIVKYSEKYIYKLKVENQNKKIIIELHKDLNKKSLKTLDKVFDELSEESKEIKAIFEDFFYEIFVFSNFGEFNAKGNMDENNINNLIIKYSHETKDAEENIYKFEIYNNDKSTLTLTSLQNQDP